MAQFGIYTCGAFRGALNLVSLLYDTTCIKETATNHVATECTMAADLAFYLRLQLFICLHLHWLATFVTSFEWSMRGFTQDTPQTTW